MGTRMIEPPEYPTPEDTFYKYPIPPLPIFPPDHLYPCTIINSLPQKSPQTLVAALWRDR